VRKQRRGFFDGRIAGQDATGSVADSAGAGRRGGIGSDLVQTLAARDYKGVGNQYVEENKLIVDSQVARMRGFGDYEMDQTASALKARDYKDVTDIVVRQES